MLIVRRAPPRASPPASPARAAHWRGSRAPHRGQRCSPCRGRQHPAPSRRSRRRRHRRAAPPARRGFPAPPPRPKPASRSRIPIARSPAYRPHIGRSREARVRARAGDRCKAARSPAPAGKRSPQAACRPGAIVRAARSSASGGGGGSRDEQRGGEQDTRHDALSSAASTGPPRYIASPAPPPPAPRGCLGGGDQAIGHDAAASVTGTVAAATARRSTGCPSASRRAPPDTARAPGRAASCR